MAGDLSHGSFRQRRRCWLRRTCMADTHACAGIGGSDALVLDISATHHAPKLGRSYGAGGDGAGTT
jgi:hypothetical protein